MKSYSNITKFLSEQFIQKHAVPSNIKYGKAICARKAITLINSSDEKVEAWVGGLDGAVVEGGGSRRRVEFAASKDGLIWNCTGNPKNH